MPKNQRLYAMPISKYFGDSNILSCIRIQTLPSREREYGFEFHFSFTPQLSRRADETTCVLILLFPTDNRLSFNSISRKNFLWTRNHASRIWQAWRRLTAVLSLTIIKTKSQKRCLSYSPPDPSLSSGQKFFNELVILLIGLSVIVKTQLAEKKFDVSFVDRTEPYRYLF